MEIEVTGFHIQGGILKGKNKDKFEAAIGVILAPKVLGIDHLFGMRLSTHLNDVIPSGSIGIRRQKPGKSFMIRYGLGFPETLYLGFGFSF